MPEPVEPSRHEHRRAVEVERALETADARGRKLRKLGSEALDEAFSLDRALRNTGALFAALDAVTTDP